MSRSEEFEEQRSLLFSIAYRILGSVAEAEDAVQESWLRYQAHEVQANEVFGHRAAGSGGNQAARSAALQAQRV